MFSEGSTRCLLGWPTFLAGSPLSSRSVSDQNSPVGSVEAFLLDSGFLFEVHESTCRGFPFIPSSVCVILLLSCPELLPSPYYVSYQSITCPGLLLSDTLCLLS